VRSLKETKAFVLANNFYLKDSSNEGSSLTLAYKNSGGESIGINATQGKVDMIIYFVDNKAAYDSVKSELQKLEFTADKPYQNDKEGIVEELGYGKNKTVVIASIRKNKANGLQYDFLVTRSF
jgi:hypothetical protein